MNRKILMTLNRMDIGGAETHVAELANELHRRGWDVVLASNGGAYVPKLEAAGLRHVQIPLHKRGWKEMRESEKKLEQLIRAEQPDIVHAHARLPGYLCGRLQKRMKFPFVTTAHWVFHTNWLLKRVTDWGQRTIAVSEDIKTYLIENYHVPAEHITVTINGIDTEAFSANTDGSALAEELGLDLSRPVLGTVSRLDPDRSLASEKLLAIAPRLQEAISGLQLLIVGGGGDFQRLKQQADELNHNAEQKYIFMTGPRTDVEQAVAVCTAFVGVSRAALEAMAAAKPVILAGNEGYQGIFSQQLLQEAQSSNFCCRGAEGIQEDVLLRDCVALLDLDGAERQTLGEYGRSVILEEYSVSRMAEDCIGVYESVLKL